MKKQTVFIILIISVLAFQIFTEGYFSFCEEINARKEKTEISIAGYRKLLLTDSRLKAIHDYIFPVFAWSYLNYCGMISSAACFDIGSDFICKLFNRSPPGISYSV